jgi:hypothetical protein
MRRHTARLTCQSADITILDQLPMIGTDRLAILWDAIREDPLREVFRSDWMPRTFIEFLQHQGPQCLPLVAEVRGCVAGACWARQMTFDPDTGQPWHCHVDLFIMPAFRGASTIPLGQAFRRHLLEVYRVQNFFAVVRYDHRACQLMMPRWGMHQTGVLPSYLPVDGHLQDVLLYSAQPPKSAQRSKEP